MGTIANIIKVFCPIAFYQAIFIILFLFSLKKGGKTQNRLLALYLLTFGSILGVWYFDVRPAAIQNVVSLGMYFTFLIGPLFYFYLKSVLKPALKFRKRDFFHLIPFIIVLITNLIVNIVKQRNTIVNTLALNDLDILNLIQIIAYFVWSIFELKLHYLFTQPERLNLTRLQRIWLIYFILSNTLIWLFRNFSLLVIYGLVRMPNWCGWLSTLFWLSTSLFFNSVAYIALMIPDIFSKSKKYKNNALPKSMKHQCLVKLNQLMESEQIYLDPLLSLNSLAKRLSISPKYLSMIINEEYNHNFYDFINKYRVEEVKRLIADQKTKSTFLEIAFKVGFNSKPTFNTAFKKFTGMTPSAFKSSLS